MWSEHDWCPVFDRHVSLCVKSFITADAFIKNAKSNANFASAMLLDSQ